MNRKTNKSNSRLKNRSSLECSYDPLKLMRKLKLLQKDYKISFLRKESIQ